MQKITLSVLAAMVATLPLMAADQEVVQVVLVEKFRAENDIIFRVGVDALGSNDDTSTLSGGGKEGLDKKTGYELSLGAEEKVKNFEWGSRRLMTFYDYGRGTYYNDDYKAKTRNFGIETTMARYIKLTQYVKPYLGLGLGINVNDYDDGGRSKNAQEFQLTVNGVAGVSGELVVGIGYFVEYKYRLASNTTEQLVLKDSSGTVEVENKGVSGGQLMAGLSYQF